ERASVCVRSWSLPVCGPGDHLASSRASLPTTRSFTRSLSGRNATHILFFMSVPPSLSRSPIFWERPVRPWWRSHSLPGAVSWLPGCLPVSGAAVAGGAGHADRLGAGGREVEVVEVGVGHGAVEADGFVGHRQGQGDGVVGLDEAGFA